MKSLKIILTYFIFILSAYSVQSYPRHKAGISFSTISGAGISYQIEINKFWAFQISAFPYYFGTNPHEDLDIYLIAGAEFQYNFLNDKSNRLFSFIGFSRWYVEERTVNEYVFNDVEIIEKNKNIYLLDNAGFGIGYEFIVKNSVALNINLGLHYQSSEESHLGILIDRNPDGTKYLGIGGGIGIYILF